MTSLDEALDRAVAAQERTEWLEGRREGFGASDVPVLMILLGWVSDDDLTSYTTWNNEKVYTTRRYMVRAAETVDHILVPRPDRKPSQPERMRVPFGFPRIIGEKLGVIAPPPDSDAQAEGKAKEKLLFTHSRLGAFKTRAWYAPEEAHNAPVEWLERAVSTSPLVVRDAVEPALRVTVEAWEDVSRGRIAWELQTDRAGTLTKPPWWKKWQAKAEATALDCGGWGLQYGPGWALVDEPAFPDLLDPVQFGPFELKDADRDMVRRAVREGVALVEKAKEMRR